MFIVGENSILIIKGKMMIQTCILEQDIKKKKTTPQHHPTILFVKKLGLSLNIVVIASKLIHFGIDLSVTVCTVLYLRNFT